LEVFIFTASRREYARAVVQKFLPGWPEERLLSREWCIRGMLRGRRVYVKDVRMFDESLRGVLLVDDRYESYVLTPENGVRVKGWRGESEDRELLDRILPIVEWCRVVKEDVREVLRGLGVGDVGDVGGAGGADGADGAGGTGGVERAVWGEGDGESGREGAVRLR
jgi:TFIIF-interacting CTD phosphatase-like protein